MSRLALHVAHHRRVVAGERLQGGHEVGVGQEAAVEHQVGLGGHAELVAERHHGEDDGRGLVADVVVLADVVAELVHRVVRGVQHEVGHLADGPQRLPLLPDALDGRLVDGQRVRPPRLVVAAGQRLLVGLQEEQADGHPLAAQMAQHARELLQELRLPDVHHQRRSLQLVVPRHQVGEGRDQRAGKVVHAEPAHVLQRAGHVRLARAGEARDDEDLRLALLLAAVGAEGGHRRAARAGSESRRESLGGLPPLRSFAPEPPRAARATPRRARGRSAAASPSASSTRSANSRAAS